MARHTSFRIGGPADALVEPLDESQLRQVIQWAHAQHIPFMVLGGGTNLLVRDGGIRGVVLRLSRMAAGIEWHRNAEKIMIRAGAGVQTRRLCRLALGQGWRGMNFALGIPGSLGGAVMMNAGTTGGCMRDVLCALTLLTTEGRHVELGASQIRSDYRRLLLPATAGPAPIVLAVKLTLEMAADRGQLRAEAQRLMRGRAGRQPARWANAGCFFKNPSPQHPAGRLIDAAGLKGVMVGQAQVSPQHANFIVNLGGATAGEVLTLVDKIQTAVWQRYRIWLEPEVRIVGESTSAQGS